jgi:hypothetical protein
MAHHLFARIANLRNLVSFNVSEKKFGAEPVEKSEAFHFKPTTLNFELRLTKWLVECCGLTPDRDLAFCIPREKLEQEGGGHIWTKTNGSS